MDFVFIDGPHTYANVRNVPSNSLINTSSLEDLQLWEPRVRRGGIIAGHDFTARHPPLLWAVTEHRMTHVAWMQRTIETSRGWRLHQSGHGRGLVVAHHIKHKRNNIILNLNHSSVHIIRFSI